MTQDLERQLRQTLQTVAERSEAQERLMAEQASDMAKVKVLLAEFLEQRILIDQLIAWVHGADMLPELTPGGQAIKCKKGTSRDPF